MCVTLGFETLTLFANKIFRENESFTLFLPHDFVFVWALVV